MPIPLIAAALIAAGAATGGTGVALGGKGGVDIKKARSRIKAAEKRYVAKRALTDDAVSATNRRLAALGDQQAQALADVVVRMGEFLRRHERQVRESERLLVDGIDVTVGSVQGSARLDPDAVAWVRGVIGSAVTGGGASIGVTTAVGTYGVASTGTAISGLSGAAAQSATLAALGGGSLASGGGGMALGTTVLNVITVGPALLIGGMVVKGQGTKAITQAREYEAKVAIAIADLSDTRTRLEAVDQRADELGDLLRALVSRGVDALDRLECEPFDENAHVERFQRALNVAMAVRDVAATPVLDGAGELNDKTDGLIIKYRPMTQGGST